jgi:luciferase family oxidoreductase group 1
MKLSVLDQSPIRHGGTPAQAVAETLELARAADRLGYSRYWLAEHHSSEGLAGTAPEILIARIAAETSNIRVGSGGIMLSHYAPLKVAETFRMLETLYPGRIDLGIGRAPGSDQRTASALQHGPGALGIEHFPAQIAELMGFLTDALPANHPFTGVHAMPTGKSVPEFWLLGSSDQSAAYAAYFGCAFSFAHFINDEGGAGVMEGYRRHFRPSAGLVAPRGSIGVFVLCAETEAAADNLASSRDLWRCASIKASSGRFLPSRRRWPIAITKANWRASSITAAASSSAPRIRSRRAFSPSPTPMTSRNWSSSRSATISPPGCAHTSCWPRPSRCRSGDNLRFKDVATNIRKNSQKYDF